MQNLQQLYNSGLYINDFATHDSSRDLVLASTQQAAELKLLLDQEAEKAEKMKESMKKLRSERRRTDQILYQLLPRSVSDHLRKGGTAIATCEHVNSQTFESVTILFTDVVGFTTICAGISPMDVVNFLNDMYGQFDSVTEKHGVFKVETIGDAYMIVGGAPNRTEHHTELIIDTGLELLSIVSPMKEQSSGKIVQIRAGAHTGAVVAGVVGLKMPRYCLFGDTVLIANKMESTGKPMRLQISETTKAKLDQTVPGLFETERYDKYDIGGGEILATYWLNAKNGAERQVTPPPEEESDAESDLSEAAADGDATPTAQPGSAAMSRRSRCQSQTL